MSFPTKKAAAGTAWIRQLWAPMILWGHYVVNEHHPARLANGYACNATLTMPTDFSTLNNLNLILYPAANANITIRVTISFGQDGEAFNTHTQWQNVVVAMVANVFTSIDLVATFGALLANLAAGDHLLVRVDHLVATLIYVYGVDARYS